ncbi:hypothetical protein CDAR_290511 [Caerostris darwini]|uniref:Uncharacterized protein n=1 Tax=Caerostris darwini TaxID=1538125 RepID=A0AAV4N3J3_9ARAC|nr:hypothetical protein CDAR_290511 [Caerostris darwini]
MITKTCVYFTIAVILMTEGHTKFGSYSREVDKRTGWEPEVGGGWAAPMPTPPPKIILIENNKGGQNGGNQKEDKISMLMPVIMSLGPLILAAILMPIFMSLLSGIMSFVKSMLAMKMPSMMMPNMNMMIPAMMPMPLPMPTLPPTEAIVPFVKGIHIIARKNNDTGLDAWTKVARVPAFHVNSNSALSLGRGF